MIIRAKGKQFKRGCVYYNTETNQVERVITITETTLGTKAAWNAVIEIHPRENFRSPSKMEIEQFIVGKPKFAKKAAAITDADHTALAYGDKVVVIANTDSRLEKIQTAIANGNNRSLAQLLRVRKQKPQTK